MPIVDPADKNLIDTVQKPIRDSIITRFRSWKDYSGHNYEGKYQIKISDFKNAHYYKNSLTISQNSPNAYDGIVFNLKQNTPQHPTEVLAAVSLLRYSLAGPPWVSGRFGGVASVTPVEIPSR